jgi:hypothetical protein
MTLDIKILLAFMKFSSCRQVLICLDSKELYCSALPLHP